MSGQHEMPTASVVRSSQATPARRRGQLSADVKPAALHLTKPVRCSDNRGHLYLGSANPDSHWAEPAVIVAVLEMCSI